MSKIIDVIQWSMFLLSIVALLFVSWKIGALILTISFLIGRSRQKWGNHE